MRKFLASVAFVLVFGLYALGQYASNASAVNYTAATASAPAPPLESAPPPIAGAPPPAPPPVPTPAPAPKPKQKGEYIDGSYTGSLADAYYGYVQVRATVAGGRLTGVAFLQYPSDRSTSRMINGQAMPLLIREAVQAQSAHVDGVSGATDTSIAFAQSLSSALAQAKS